MHEIEALLLKFHQFSRNRPYIMYVEVTFMKNKRNASNPLLYGFREMNLKTGVIFELGSLYFCSACLSLKLNSLFADLNLKIKTKSAFLLSEGMTPIMPLVIRKIACIILLDASRLALFSRL